VKQIASCVAMTEQTKSKNINNNNNENEKVKTFEEYRMAENSRSLFTVFGTDAARRLCPAHA
jgi:hypothetical protein